MKKKIKTSGIKKAIIALTICFLFASYNLIQAQLTWIPYTGTVPNNAVKGGAENGHDIFIARAMHKGNFHPGKLVGRSCNIGYGGKETIIRQFELLVNNGNVNLKWTKVNNNAVPKNAVAGGKENGQTLYVGRAKRSADGSTHPGKILKTGGRYICNYGWGGKEITERNNFEVLVYFTTTPTTSKPTTSQSTLNPITPDVNAIYVLKSKAAGHQNIDVHGAKTTNGTNITLYGSNSDDGFYNQRFRFVDAGGGYYRIETNMKKGIAIDIYYARTADQSNANLWEKNGNNAQRFKLIDAGNGYVKIVSAMGENLFLGVSDDNKNVVLRNGDKGDRVLFKLNKTSSQNTSATPTNDSQVIEPEIPDATYIPATSWIALNRSTLGNRKLNRLVLPGSHDSGTYDLTGTWNNDINDTHAPDTDEQKRGLSWLGDISYNNWAQAQEKNIYHQLNDGIRCIDIRICIDKSDRIKTCHGLYGSRIEEILDHAKKFSDENPNEPFILDFNHFYDWKEKTNNKEEDNANYQGIRQEMLNKLSDMIQQRLGTRLAPNTLTPESTLNELMATNRPVIVSWSKGRNTTFQRDYFWDSNYAKTYDDDIKEFKNDKILHLGKKLREYANDANEKRFVRNDIQITPSESLYKQGADPTGSYPSGLETLAKQTNPVILSYINNEWKDLRHNIISADFYNQSGLITLCKKINGLQVNNPNNWGYSIAERNASKWGDWSLGVSSPFTVAPDHEYKVEIDCNHSDLDDTKTGAKITVSFFKGNLRVGGKYKNGVTDCALMDATFHFETTMELTHIVVSTDGGDAFYIDEVRIYRGGDLLVHHGRDDGSGWCLSTDTNDYQGGWEDNVSGNTCKSAHTFSFDARRPVEYKVTIDCSHSDLDDTDTGAKISVEFWAGTKLVKSKYRNGVGSCSTSDASWEIFTGEEISHVIIKTNGGDAYYIDELRLYKDGDLVKHEGRDDGSGWCLSTDANDYKGDWEGKTAGACQSSYKFNF